MCASAYNRTHVYSYESVSVCSLSLSLSFCVYTFFFHLVVFFRCSLCADQSYFFPFKIDRQTWYATCVNKTRKPHISFDLIWLYYWILQKTFSRAVHLAIINFNWFYWPINVRQMLNFKFKLKRWNSISTNTETRKAKNECKDGDFATLRRHFVCKFKCTLRQRKNSVSRVFTLPDFFSLSFQSFFDFVQCDRNGLTKCRIVAKNAFFYVIHSLKMLPKSGQCISLFICLFKFVMILVVCRPHNDIYIKLWLRDSGNCFIDANFERNNTPKRNICWK